MIGKFCSVQRTGQVTLIAINGPEAMNALHPSARFELEEAFSDFAADPDQWIAVIKGAGRPRTTCSRIC